jgi:hypothetical protein
MPSGQTLTASEMVRGLVKLNRKECLEERLSKAALKRDGREHWSEAVLDAVELLQNVSVGALKDVYEIVSDLAKKANLATEVAELRGKLEQLEEEHAQEVQQLKATDQGA